MKKQGVGFKEAWVKEGKTAVGSLDILKDGRREVSKKDVSSGFGG